MVTLKTLLANVSKSVLIISILNKENNLTVEKKHLLLDFPYLGIIYLQTRTKLQQAWKSVLNYCKPEIAFKCQARLSNSFCYKDLIPKDLISRVVWVVYILKEQCQKENQTNIYALNFSLFWLFIKLAS